MNRILKNNTASPVLITDTGITVPASGSYTIAPEYYGKFEASVDVITLLTNHSVSPTVSTLKANDGSVDLPENDGVRLILGEWSRQICDGDDSSIKANVITSGLKKRLCVDTVTTTAGALIPSLTSKLRYLDMNASYGGVVRGTAISTSWVSVFHISGSGFIHGFDLNLETKDKWQIRFIIDEDEIFDTNGVSTDDLISDVIYDLDGYITNLNEDYTNIGLHFGLHDKIMWGFSSLPLKYYASVKILIKRTTAGTKKFNAGLFVISRD